MINASKNALYVARKYNSTQFLLQRLKTRLKKTESGMIEASKSSECYNLISNSSTSKKKEESIKKDLDILQEKTRIDNKNIGLLSHIIENISRNEQNKEKCAQFLAHCADMLAVSDLNHSTPTKVMGRPIQKSHNTFDASDGSQFKFKRIDIQREVRDIAAQVDSDEIDIDRCKEMIEEIVQKIEWELSEVEEYTIALSQNMEISHAEYISCLEKLEALKENEGDTREEVMEMARIETKLSATRNIEELKTHRQIKSLKKR